MFYNKTQKHETMKNLKQYTDFLNGKNVKSVICKNGRTYYFGSFNENDWLFSFSSKRTSYKWDDEKIMTYNDFDKFLKAVNRILKNQI